jgi:hypothetical protein
MTTPQPIGLPAGTLPDPILLAIPVAAFWLFIAAVVVVAIRAGLAHRREIETTIRLAIEKGQTLDPATIDRLRSRALSAQHTTRGLLVGGIVVLSVAFGLPILGWILSQQVVEVFYPLLGAGALVACIGVGLLIAATVTRRLGDLP